MMLIIAGAQAQKPTATPGERLVNIAPCRLVDTRVNPPADAAEEAARKIDVASTRCGRFVPSSSAAYALRITTYDRASDGKTPTQATGLRGALSRHPAGPPITFPVPGGSHITVDLEGYYVAPNTPVDPTLEGLSIGLAASSGRASITPQALSTGTPLRPTPEVLHDGTAGEMYLDASRTGDVGVFGISSAGHPWIKFMSGLSDGSDGFGVYNANFSELMRVSSNGPTRLIPGWSFLSGRTDYRESANVPNNVVHYVRIVDPRDSTGGATSRVTFFDAKTDSEVNSPSTTKFRAYTFGSTTQSHINFDSQIVDHNSNQYYYRGLSVFDPDGVGKETFWIKAATNASSFVNTRADMYVSGNVGIGTTTPSVKLQVEDLNNNTELVVSAGDAPGSPNSATMTLMRKDGNHALLAKYGLKLDANDGNKFKISYTTAGVTTTPVTIDTAGNATFAGNVSAGGVINAKYQDVAEWVPAGGALRPGTVVTLNREKTNEVTPSTKAYDTAVAGVVSDQPGVLLGTAGADKAKIATTGRVKVRVDARTHPITVGDLLVTSDVPGTAMLSEPMEINGRKFHQPGTLIGKALEPLAGGEGEILVLLSLQ